MTNLCKINWNNTYRSSDVNKSFSRFYKNINRLILNKHAPLKDVSKRRQKLLTKPWLTKGIRRSIRVKNNLFLGVLKTKTPPPYFLGLQNYDQPVANSTESWALATRILRLLLTSWTGNWGIGFVLNRPVVSSKFLTSTVNDLDEKWRYDYC